MLSTRALRQLPKQLPPSSSRLLSTTLETTSSEQPTHYRITLLRSAISLPSRIKGTLVSLGIHRRLQTVYHPHSQINAGKTLRVKELVAVENVPASAVRNKTEQRVERRAARGYEVRASKLSQPEI